MKVQLLSVQFEVVTPMFLGGASQKQAEIRIPSIKGMLRSWYRIVEPRYCQPIPEEKGKTREEILFGGTRAGGRQSRFLLRLRSELNKETDIDRVHKDLFKQLDYLSFSIKSRQYIRPEHSFKLDVVMRPSSSSEKREKDWQAMIASLWLLGNLGALGARNRRGFGQLRLISWETEVDEAREQINQLPLLNEAQSIHEWMELFQEGLGVLKEWFHWENLLMPKLSFIYYHRQGKDDWTEALAEGANQIQEFRKANKDIRFALGLPMVVNDLKANKTRRYIPNAFPRLASPVQLRVINIGNKYHPIFLFPSKDDMFSFSIVEIEKEKPKKGFKGVKKDLKKKRAPKRKELHGCVSIEEMVEAFIDSLPEEKWEAVQL